MRGTHNRITPAHHTAGLIPTYAGNTSHAEGGDEAFRAHPHVCGEHVVPEIVNTVQKGSSPRMRGTPTNVLIDPEEEGLIPTYAGNTCRLCGSQYPSRAHPHVCGEHLLDKVIIW